MFAALVAFAVRRRVLVLALAALFALVAARAFQDLPIEAFPDVTDPSVDVIATFPGQSGEEVERRVTLELERVLAGAPGLTNLRTVSVFGLALCTLRFQDGIPDQVLRAQVAERLREAELPDGVEAVLGPAATPVGQIYRYTLRGPRSLRDLRALQDWVVERQLRAVPGVADVITFGGYERQYQVRIDPVRLSNLGVSVHRVYEALERSNSNSGGGYVGIGSQEFVVRGLGTLHDPADLGDALVGESNGVPIRIRDVADVVEGSMPRRGAVGRTVEDEVVEGIVLLRRGENPSVVLDALRARIDLLQHSVLPRDVRLETFYDRGNLIRATLHTVRENLLHGAVLVVIVLFLFLRTLRGALIVAAVIPLALLTSFLGLRLMGRSANLISLGAIDFGILVDGAVVVLEATLHTLSRAHARPGVKPVDRQTLIARAGATVARPVVFAMLIIAAGLVPIFTLQRVEGRIFAPMALTYVFALLGALIAATTVVPALEAVALPKVLPDGDGAAMVWLQGRYVRVLNAFRSRRVAVFTGAAAVLLAMTMVARSIGTEFLPELNEGGLYITAVFPSTISLDETRRSVPQMRARMMALPETIDVLSHIGRPEEAAQAEGPNNVEFFIALAPVEQWRHGMTRADLEDELRHTLREIPGVQYNFSQPITDRVYETISGIIGQVVVKFRGEDLAQLTRLAEQYKERLHGVPGITDLSLYQAGDVPQVSIELDRERLARQGLDVQDADTAIETALGGKVATSVWQGERRYTVALRLPDTVRANPDALGRLPLGDADRRVTLGEVANIHFTRGRAAIWREDLSRFVALKFNVRGRDLGSVVADAQARAHGIEVPEGVGVAWGGEFENQRRAMARLAVVVPLTLLLIAWILQVNFRRWRPALAIMALLPGAGLGAVAALQLAGENFSVSAAVGCVALLGQVALGGVLVWERIELARQEGVADPVAQGASEALRPVLLTSLLALLGLVPAAMSHAMGSETQRPFALAIIGGLLAALPWILGVLPLLADRRDAHGDHDGHGHGHGHGPAHAAAVVALALAVTVAPWRAMAQSLTEATLIARWARDGAEAQALRSRVGAARFDVVTAGLLPNPSVSVGASGLLAGVAPDGNFNLSAQVSMPLLLAGQRGVREEAAWRAVDAADAELRVALWQRLGVLRGAIRQRAFAEARVALADHQIAELQEILTLVRSRAGAGVSSTYDQARIETELATMTAERAQRELDRMQAESTLVSQLAIPGLAQAAVSRGDLAQWDDASTDESMVVEALSRRPDLALARRNEQAAEAQARRWSRDAAPVPEVWIGSLLTWGQSSSSLLGGVTVPLPMFDRNQGQVGRSRAEALVARGLGDAVSLQVRAEVRGALAARTVAREALTQYRARGLAATEDLRDRARRAYQAGQFSMTDLLDAYRAGWAARAEEVDLEARAADAEADLFHAMGDRTLR